jgi:hypothetical protein
MTYSAPADKVVLTIGAPSATPSVPQEWAKFYAMLSPPGMFSSGTVFLHERTSPSGNRRLVAVDASLSMHSTPAILLVPRVIRPGSLLAEPAESIHTSAGYISAPPADAVHAGQLDSADASHFTIRVVSNSREQILDGWLRDDDQVVIERRSSATAPATRSLP